MDPAVSELLESCAAARREGADFPTIWNTLLAKHPMVADLPWSTGGLLSIPLITGDQLVFGEEFAVVEGSAGR